ncbi:HTH-type transcriptional repressor yvoA, partial [Dysosmobacter welbionis]
SRTASARWTAPPRRASPPWAAPASTSFRRTKGGSDRLTDIPHRDQTKPRRRGQLPGPAGRNQALGKAQPPDLADPLAQLADGPQLSGEAHLPDGHQIRRHRPVQIAGGQGDHRRQIRGGLVQAQAADDVQV